MFPVVGPTEAKNFAKLGAEDRPLGSGEAFNHGTPSTPRPSASMILITESRDRRGVEVLMAKRTSNATFMPGVWVFPGGGLEADDDQQAEQHEARRRCAERELMEEVGIEIPADRQRVLFSRWITPEAVKVRFDAWFFIASVPERITPCPDGNEAVEAAWITPEAALDKHAAGSMNLSFPTVHQLRELRSYGDPQEILATYADHVPTVMLPKPVETAEGVRLALPGDAEYPH